MSSGKGKSSDSQDSSLLQVLILPSSAKSEPILREDVDKLTDKIKELELENTQL